MRIGEPKHYYQEASLHDWVNNSGYGIIGLQDYMEVPGEAIEFCFSQYDRFGIPRPPKDVVQLGAWCALWAIDVIDPYLLFCGVSNVELSDEWQKYTYEITDLNNKLHEADPEHLETFIEVPGKDEFMFNDLIQKPGLDALPCGAGDLFRDVMEGHTYTAEPVYSMMSEASLKWMTDMCTDELGDRDMVKFRAFFELSAWAGFLWLAGPLGREFRYNHHEIFHQAMTNGEAVLYDCFVLSFDSYKKVHRPPQSCAECGLDSWCVELVHLNGVTRFLCERHLNGDLPLYGDANCGSKFCKAVECHFHPNYGQQDAYYRTLSGKGMLSAMASQNRLAIEGAKPKLLAN